MSALPWRLATSLAFFLPSVVHAQAGTPRAAPGYSRIPSRIASERGARGRAQSFLLPRLAAAPSLHASPGVLRLRGMRQRDLVPHLLSGNQPWQAVGPEQVTTAQFGAVTGRVTSLAIAPWDASGNTVYLGSTGGGVWRSSNAAASNAASVAWQPLTDEPPAYSGVNVTSLSIGAVSVAPGSSPNAVVLAGTGDPNDALDSYYGAGILRSADGGTTWTLITESKDAFSGGLTNYSFVGDAFSGFAWSTANPSLVVAAVTNSYDGFVNNVNNSNQINKPDGINVAEAGLYYSTDAGATWFLSTIEDGANKVIQSSQTTDPQQFPGAPATSVVWNPVRRMFVAAVADHGYYASADGATWTRLQNQPGAGLSANTCTFTGSSTCPIARGVLGVNAVTGDMFALTVDGNDVDQGLWQDVCGAVSGACANPVQFGVQIADTALEDQSGQGTIPEGTYDLALAAVANGSDTLLFAGTADIYRCSLSAGCAWRNTTNTGSCASGQVAPAEHAIAGLAAPPGETLPLLFFGNDGGVWRSTDGVNQSGAVCAGSDAAHFENLNGGLGSLAEVAGLASSATDENVLLAGFGVNGSAAAASASLSAWPQLLTAEGGETAIDSANPDNWYATLGPGVAIGQCTQGTNCSAADFSLAVGAAETEGDESLLTAPYLLDPNDSGNLIVGTCRVWRGAASGGSAWSAANAISPMLDGRAEPYCNGNALIRSLAAGGAGVSSGSAESSGSQVIYAGMAGLLDGGGSAVSGDIFSTTAANLANGSTAWMDLAQPASGQRVFNPYRFDVSAIYVDPHDGTGNTVYAAVQGFGVPHLYRSTDGGASWINITKNLPDLPLNDVFVDPNDAGVVYAASDGGVFVTTDVTNCTQSGGQCWNILGTGLPLAPAVKFSWTAAAGGLLRVGTYGRGVWQAPLLGGAAQTSMTVSPTSVNFGSQQVGSSSAPQTVTVSNSGSANLVVGSPAVSGDFFETDNCTGAPVAPGGSCRIQVTFAPAAGGTRSGTLTVPANIAGGQQSVALSGNGGTGTEIVILPGSLSFDSQVVNSSSAAQQLTIANTTNSAVTMTSVTVSGPFAIATNACGATLAANSACTLGIIFSPTLAGAATGQVSVVTSVGANVVGLSGTGESAATDTVSPLSLSFPATQENTASAPQTITLSNTGGVALTGISVQTAGDFATVNGCGISLNAGSSCTLTVRYTPHAAGLETGTVAITDAMRSQTVSLSGSGLAAATDTLSATSLTFPATAVGHAAPPQTVTLTNTGDAALGGLSMVAVGAGYSQGNNCGATLSAHSSCTIIVSFTAIANGSTSGQVNVTDALRTQVIALSGSGQALAADNVSPQALTFSGQAVGTTSAGQTVMLSNNGQGMLTGIRLQSENPDFAFTTNCGTTLAAGTACAIELYFSPRTSGPDAGTLLVVDANRSQQVALAGNGTLANIALSPGSLDFGDIGVEVSSAPQILTLTNGSNSAITGISYTLSGAYTATSSCGTTLAAGATCELAIAFSPVVTGSQAGLVTVTSANAGALTAQLSGVGLAFALLPTSSTSASVKSGSAAGYSLEMVPTNGSAGNVTLTCGNLPPNASCTVTPGSATLLSSQNLQVAIGTGIGNSAVRARPAAMGGEMPWPAGLLLVLLSLVGLQRQRGRLGVRFHGLLTILLMMAAAAGMTACGKGVGPLGPGTPNPLPTNSMTPPGSYTVTVTGSAGGLARNVSLTVQVQ